jgi:hypothetical protein
MVKCSGRFDACGSSYTTKGAKSRNFLGGAQNLAKKQ